jgi:catenin alpha
MNSYSTTSDHNGVDDITPVDDFLALSENHILEVVNKCLAVLQESDPEALDRTAGAIRGRGGRICNVVALEMDNHEPGLYAESVLEAIRLLSDRVMPLFAQKVKGALEALGGRGQEAVDEDVFINATRLAYDGVSGVKMCLVGKDPN